MTNGHHHTKSNGSSPPQQHEVVHSNRDSQIILCRGRQAPNRGHILHTRKRPVENAVGTDTGLEDVTQCYLSKLTGKLIEEEHHLSAEGMIGREQL